MDRKNLRHMRAAVARIEKAVGSADTQDRVLRSMLESMYANVEAMDFYLDKYAGAYGVENPEPKASADETGGAQRLGRKGYGR